MAEQAWYYKYIKVRLVFGLGKNDFYGRAFLSWEGLLCACHKKNFALLVRISALNGFVFMPGGNKGCFEQGLGIVELNVVVVTSQLLKADTL
jgi:hypothetical protein